jgi:large subunit ribosomal protein L29
MAILKMKKIREMNDKEISEKLKELRLEISKDRASSEIGTVKNPGRIKEMRRTVARIMFEKSVRSKNAAKKKEVK